MMTETILRKVLDKLEHRPAGKSHGRPMSGLSIPAEYYLAGPGRKIAAVGRGKKSAKTVADGPAVRPYLKSKTFE